MKIKVVAEERHLAKSVLGFVDSAASIGSAGEMPMMFYRMLFVAGLAVTLLGCGDEGGEGEATIFVRHPSNPVYQSSASAWNFAGIGDPSVIYDSDDGVYKMWTSGGGVVPPDPSVIVRTQYLTSPDGVTWTESAVNPVLFEGAGGSDWDRGGVETVMVLKDGGQYYLWYGGYEVREDPPLTLQIGLATSSDGINWSKSLANPVLSPGTSGEWDEGWVESPSVVKVGSTFHMLYSGVNLVSEYRIGLATSPDGVTWTKHPSNPGLSPEPANSWENAFVYAPSILHDGAEFKMWYVGLNATTFLSEVRIGMAASPDGVTWTRSPDNFVLGLGPSGAWDEAGAFVPSVILRGGEYMMWYLCGSNPNEKVGLATWTP